MKVYFDLKHNCSGEQEKEMDVFLSRGLSGTVLHTVYTSNINLQPEGSVKSAG